MVTRQTYVSISLDPGIQDTFSRREYQGNDHEKERVILLPILVFIMPYDNPITESDTTVVLFVSPSVATFSQHY